MVIIVLVVPIGNKIIVCYIIFTLKCEILFPSPLTINCTHWMKMSCVIQDNAEKRSSYKFNFIEKLNKKNSPLYILETLF